MPPKRIIVALLLAASLIGFIDAAYLTAKHYLGAPPPCGRFGGCETVTTSEYAAIAGVPLALLGAVYYLAVFLSVIAYLDTRRPGILRMTAGFTAVGFLASLWFVYLQLFVIKAICPYCMLSAFASTVLFIVGMIVLRGQRELDSSSADARSR
ncbi:MAG: vitamin K epoxide reductase family protein [Candidatus Manganitrophus sp. SA1]|nr:vitamin K epoxide reductase family protein [Candidatus Manganitrophus morganii]